MCNPESQMSSTGLGRKYSDIVHRQTRGLARCLLIFREQSNSCNFAGSFSTLGYPRVKPPTLLQTFTDSIVDVEGYVAGFHHESHKLPHLLTPTTWPTTFTLTNSFPGQLTHSCLWLMQDSSTTFRPLEWKTPLAPGLP